MPHFEWIHLICAGAVAAAAFLVVLHILFTMRDDSERASMWIILVLCLPVAGIVLYLLAGITRRNTLGKRISHAVEEFLRSRDEAEHRGLKEYRGAMERFVSDGGSRESTMSHRRMLDALIRASLEDPASASMIPGTIPLSGNRLELLCDGSAAYPAMIESIRAARHNINMQTFIFADDRFGRIMMGELRKKALEGVQVRVICDRFGSFKSLFFLFFLPYLKRTPNLHVIPFSNTSLLTPWRIQLRNHRKLLVVDGRTAFIGGLNISEDNFKWLVPPSESSSMRFSATGFTRRATAMSQHFSRGSSSPFRRRAGSPSSAQFPAGTGICSKVRKKYFSLPPPRQGNPSGSFRRILLRRRIFPRRSGWRPRAAWMSG